MTAFTHGDRRRRLRAASAFFVLTLALTGAVTFVAARSDASSSATEPAPAGAGARIGLVVDLGNGTVHNFPITIGGSSTSGIGVLQSAGTAPAVRGFGGLGAAVCALTLDGAQLGCPTDETCLTCAAPSYWTYFRGPAGSSSFVTSSAGAGSTTVGDGDVEGWRWGTGAAPPFRAFNEFFPSPTTTTRATSPTTVAPTTTVLVPTTLPPAPTTTVRGVGSTSTSSATSAAGSNVDSSSTTAIGSSLSSATTAAPGSSETRRGIATRRTTTSAPERPARGPDPTTADVLSARGDDSSAGPPVVAAPADGSGAGGWIWLVAVAGLVALIGAAARRRRAGERAADW